MAKVERIAQLKRALQFAGRKYQRRVSVVVGYKAAYAIHVHEDLNATHVNGQAKFLEQPAREHASELVRVVRTVVRTKGSVEEGLRLAGLRLQRESQLLVPVDTGNLKNSAFTKVEKFGETVT